MTERERMKVCKDAFLAIDNIAFFKMKGKDLPADSFKVVDINSRRHMIVQITEKGFNVLNTSMSDTSYYKAMYFTEVNRRFIRNEVLGNA